MERARWLNNMQAHLELMYDKFAGAYWVSFGFYPNSMHCQFIDRFLGLLPPHSRILSAACGAGRYDGMLAGAGHEVLGIDQSSSMLARAREFFPEQGFPRLHYQKMRLQDMAFDSEFDGAICVDALEHICPEDWPGIAAAFARALKSGGLLYITVEVSASPEEIEEAYQRAQARGLPVVMGEIVDGINADGSPNAPIDLAEAAVYHYYPGLEKARSWFEQCSFTVEQEAVEGWYAHLLMRKRATR